MQQSLSYALSRSSSVSSSSSSSHNVTPTRRSNLDPISRSRGGAKRVMLSWAQKAVTKYAVVFLAEIQRCIDVVYVSC